VLLDLCLRQRGQLSGENELFGSLRPIVEDQYTNIIALVITILS
jgi:hypothetical protein